MQLALTSVMVMGLMNQENLEKIFLYWEIGKCWVVANINLLYVCCACAKFEIWHAFQMIAVRKRRVATLVASPRNPWPSLLRPDLLISTIQPTTQHTLVSSLFTHLPALSLASVELVVKFIRGRRQT